MEVAVPTKQRKSRKDADLKRFMKGVKEYNLTHEDLFERFNGRFKYVGGCSASARNYYNMLKRTTYRWFPNINEIPHKDYCSCGADIVYNYYVLDKHRNTIYVIGSKCIERFQIELYRTCEICGAHHRRTKTDECMPCYKEKWKTMRKMKKVAKEIKLKRVF